MSRKKSGSTEEKADHAEGRKRTDGRDLQPEPIIRRQEKDKFLAFGIRTGQLNTHTPGTHEGFQKVEG